MKALIDCNNFYASCERLFRPDLQHQPIVVLSNNDGCVIARSKEAKELGIPMGAPAFKYQSLFEREGVHIFSANFALYGDMSSRVMAILNQFCEEVEVYSIDEAFLHFEGHDLPFLRNMAMRMREEVHRCTGIPISIGLAPNKSLAKLANKWAKQHPRSTNGIHFIDSEQRRIEVLEQTSVKEVWGVGSAHAAALAKLGVHSALDFTYLNPEWVYKQMTVVGLRLWKELNGQTILAKETPLPKKNIATPRSFEKHYTTFDQLRERVATFTVVASEKLRKQGSACNAMMVFVHTNGFRADLPQYARNTLVRLPYPMQSCIELTRYSELALKQIFKEGYAYKKAGVILMDFTPATSTQYHFFEQEAPQHKKLMGTLDAINSRFGSHTLKLAVQEFRTPWKMKQQMLSPRYTTRFTELPFF